MILKRFQSTLWFLVSLSLSHCTCAEFLLLGFYISKFIIIIAAAAAAAATATTTIFVLQNLYRLHYGNNSTSHLGYIFAGVQTFFCGVLRFLIARILSLMMETVEPSPLIQIFNYIDRHQFPPQHNFDRFSLGIRLQT